MIGHSAHAVYFVLHRIVSFINIFPLSNNCLFLYNCSFLQRLWCTKTRNCCFWCWQCKLPFCVLHTFYYLPIISHWLNLDHILFVQLCLYKHCLKKIVNKPFTIQTWFPNSPHCEFEVRCNRYNIMW